MLSVNCEATKTSVELKTIDFPSSKAGVARDKAAAAVQVVIDLARDTARWVRGGIHLEEVFAGPARVFGDVDVVIAGDRGVEGERFVAAVGQLGALGDQVAEGVVEADLQRGGVGELAPLIRWSRARERE